MNLFKVILIAFFFSGVCAAPPALHYGSLTDDYFHLNENCYAPKQAMHTVVEQDRAMKEGAGVVDSTPLVAVLSGAKGLKSRSADDRELAQILFSIEQLALRYDPDAMFRDLFSSPLTEPKHIRHRNNVYGAYLYFRHQGEQNLIEKGLADRGMEKTAIQGFKDFFEKRMLPVVKKMPVFGNSTYQDAKASYINHKELAKEVIAGFKALTVSKGKTLATDSVRLAFLETPEDVEAFMSQPVDDRANIFWVFSEALFQTTKKVDVFGTRDKGLGHYDQKEPNSFLSNFYRNNPKDGALFTITDLPFDAKWAVPGLSVPFYSAEEALHALKVIEASIEVGKIDESNYAAKIQDVLREYARKGCDSSRRDAAEEIRRLKPKKSGRITHAISHFVLGLKFAHAKMKELLTATGKAPLVEGATGHVDPYHGMVWVETLKDKFYVGENKLGRELAQLRLILARTLQLSVQ